MNLFKQFLCICHGFVVEFCNIFEDHLRILFTNKKETKECFVISPIQFHSIPFNFNNLLFIKNITTREKGSERESERKRENIKYEHFKCGQIKYYGS